MSESFAELFEQSLVDSQMKPGSLLIGTVLAITGDHIIVNCGLKSEGVIPKEQFLDYEGNLEVGVGDTVEVLLEAVEDGFGETRLSREKAKRIRTWSRLEEAMDGGEIIQGTITGKVKGGFTVDVDGVRAFLPGSLVDVRPVRDTVYLEGKELDFKVIKIDQKRNNIVVSRRAVVEQEYSEEREVLLESLIEGAEVSGTVKNLTDYGAFIDLGGIDGLLHITDMAWKRVKSPSEVVEIGQELRVKVLKFDRERNRVSLGLKQLGDDPWLELKRRYPDGTRVFGQVTNIADYGCFIEVEQGVEGLVHVSEMDWTNRNVNPNRVVAVGDETEVMILDIDEERRRISLGIKQCTPNPWEEFAANHNKGDRLSGKIKSITDFGIFIGLEGGIDGLIHLSDLSWNESGDEAVRRYKKGDEVEAMVLAVDTGRERISLGIKQIDQDPFNQFVTHHPKGSVVSGTATAVELRMVTVDLGDNVTGQIRVSELARERVEDANSVVSVGDTIEARVVGIDRKSRLITLSIRAKELGEEAELINEFSQDANASVTFGDLMKDQLSRN